MRDTAAAETVVKMAVKNTHATVRKQNKPARNRRPVFKAWTVSKLLEAYKDPRAILLEIAGKDTKALAAEMQSSLSDALAERRLCAQAVLPYVAQKLPISVDMKHTRAITLNIVDEQRYQELVEVAAEPPDTEDGFSIALLPNNTDAQTPEQSVEQGCESPAQTPQAPPQQQPRQLSWDITPGNDGSQRKNVTSLEPVTPPVAAEPPGLTWLPPISEWWKRLDGARTQPLPDTAPAGPDRWEKTDHGTWAPDRRKEGG